MLLFTLSYSQQSLPFCSGLRRFYFNWIWKPTWTAGWDMVRLSVRPPKQKTRINSVWHQTEISVNLHVQYVWTAQMMSQVKLPLIHIIKTKALSGIMQHNGIQTVHVACLFLKCTPCQCQAVLLGNIPFLWPGLQLSSQGFWNTNWQLRLTSFTISHLYCINHMIVIL